MTRNSINLPDHHGHPAAAGPETQADEDYSDLELDPEELKRIDKIGLEFESRGTPRQQRSDPHQEELPSNSGKWDVSDSSQELFHRVFRETLATFEERQSREEADPYLDGPEISSQEFDQLVAAAETAARSGGSQSANTSESSSRISLDIEGFKRAVEELRRGEFVWEEGEPEWEKEGSETDKLDDSRVLREPTSDSVLHRKFLADRCETFPEPSLSDDPDSSARENAERDYLDYHRKHVEQFPEVYEPGQARLRRATNALEAEPESMDVTIAAGPQEGASIQATQEQFAQLQGDRISPYSVSTPSPILGPMRLDVADRQNSSADRPSSGGLSRLAETPLGNASIRPGSAADLAGVPARPSPENVGLTAEQQMILANWPHSRQPNFDEMSMLTSGTSPADATRPDREFTAQPASKRLSRKRPYDAVSGDDLSDGDSDSGARPSTRQPAPRRRMLPAQRDPSGLEPSRIQKDGPAGDHTSAPRNKGDHQYSDNVGNPTTPDREASRQTFNEAARARTQQDRGRSS